MNECKRMPNTRSTCVLFCSLLVFSSPSHSQEKVYTTAAGTLTSDLEAAALSWRAARDNVGIGEEYAYAFGLTGKGIKVGVIDTGVDFAEGDFPGSIKSINIQGVRTVPDPKYPHMRAGAPFIFRGDTPFPNGNNHGTGVARAMAGSNGLATHATVYAANGGLTGEWSDMPFNFRDVAIFTPIYEQLLKANVRLVNQSWGDGSTETEAGILTRYAATPVPSSLDAAATIAKAGSLSVWAGGYGSNRPDLFSGLPYYRPQLEPFWVSVVGVDKNSNLGHGITGCETNKYWCVSAPSDSTSFAAPLASGTIALLMQRYPYMTNTQVRDVMLTTATHSGDGPSGVPNQTHGWGVINIRRALEGPGQLLGAMEVNIARDARIPGRPVGTEIWSNDISDVALLNRFDEDIAEQEWWDQTKSVKRRKGELSTTVMPNDEMEFRVGAEREAARHSRVYTGSLSKKGNGTLILTGMNNYRGDTTIHEGSLIVHGSIASKVVVKNSATLSGSGSVGSLIVDSGGAINLRQPTNPLTVTGDAIFNERSRFAIELNSRNNKVLNVSGKATIHGGSVLLSSSNDNKPLRPEETLAQIGENHTILRVTGGLTGQFREVLTNYHFIGGVMEYTTNEVTARFERNNLPFANAVQTKNQKITASAIEKLGSGSQLYNSFLTATLATDIAAAFDSISGEVQASLRTALINDSYALGRAVTDRLVNAFLGDEKSIGATAVATDAGLAAPAALWWQALGQWSETGVDGNAGKLKQSTGGFVAGYDAEVVENWRLGALAGYSRTSFDVNDRNSSGHSDNYHLGIYGGTQWSATTLKAGLTYSWHKIETDRLVAFPGFSESLDADYSANSFQAFGELSHRFDLKGTAIEPFANVAVVRLQTGRFDEHGGNAALRIGKETTTTTFTTIGLRASAPVVFGSMNARLNGTAGWQHAYGDTIPTTAASFDAGTVFEVAGAPIAKDTAIIKAGFDIDLGNQTTLGLEYSGQYGSSFNQNAGKAKLSIKF